MSKYHSFIESKMAKKFKEVNAQLPLFCDSFFKVRGESMLASSMAKYASEYKMFFDWVLDNIPQITATKIADITVDDLKHITDTDIGDYLQQVRYYNIIDNEGNNIESAKATVERKSVVLSALFRYLHNADLVEKNPTATIQHRKIKRNNNIVYLDYEEQNALIDCVECGTGLPKEQIRFWKKNSTRDLAIVVTFLDTGIRVSELVGLDLNDVDFKKHRLYLTRKGDKKDWVALSDYAEEVLKDYLYVRESLYKPHEKETALFLSSRHYRMGVRNVEAMISKYADIALPHRHGEITPHKLRSTFATSLIQETGDIYLVSKSLGHSSLDTTKIYASATDSYRTNNRNRINESRNN